jgi:serine/threonine protein kinase
MAAQVVCPACGSRYGRRSTRCALDNTALVALPDPLVGRVLAGRYRIVGTLGAGAMAVVYDAVDGRDGARVAVKVFDPMVRDDDGLRERFLRECAVGRSVRHPRVAATLDAGDDGAVTFLVMQRLDGETLAARLARGPLRVSDAVACGAQLADALTALHGIGVVHRDLKPSNVFLVGDVREPIDARVLDLGVARVPDDHPLTVAGAIVGTARTMSPEQVRALPATPASDLYSLGAVLHECLTGAALFRGNDLTVRRAHLAAEPPRVRSLRPDVPVALDALLDGLLAKDPARRPPSAVVVRSLLLKLAEDPSAATEHVHASSLRAVVAPDPHVDAAAFGEAHHTLDALVAHWSTLSPVLARVAALDVSSPEGASEAELAARDDARRSALDALRRDGVTRDALRAHVAHARETAATVARALGELLASLDG